MAETVRLNLGILGTNVYILTNPETKRSIIIDPAARPDKIDQEVKSRGLTPEAVMLTHGHFDHMGAARETADLYGVPLWCSRADEAMLEDPNLNLSQIYTRPVSIHADYFYSEPAADRGVSAAAETHEVTAEAGSFADAGKEVPEYLKQISDTRIPTCLGDMWVIDTPGHTTGSVCLYFPKHQMLMSGDTLFAGSVGRSDLPTGDEDAILKSLNEKLMKLPDETKVYPGHGPATQISLERMNNPFVW